MLPVEPVLRGDIPVGLESVVYAKDQPEYLPLPVLRTPEGVVTSRWHMTWREKLRLLVSGDVYVQIYTFNQKLQPTRVFVNPGDI